MNKKINPLVSVVIITYNSSRYIIETLDSIKAQSYKEIELLISDDCSSDNTVEICSEWISENRTRFISAKIITTPVNTGISSNCNRGIKESNGEWIKVLSGDDILVNRYIEDNLEYADQNPEASFIFSRVCEIDENGKLIRSVELNEGQLLFANMNSAKKQLKYYSRWPVFLNTPTFFYKKELIQLIGYCDEDFKIYEDMSAIFRVIENNYKIYYLDKITVAYRIHSNAVSRSCKLDDRREKEALKIFKKYQEKNLNILNPFDLSVYYESWLRFKYKGIYGGKGDSLLRKLSLFYWYMRLNGVKQY
ncbi:MAG: glycosyltransferase [Bacteroidales bacterium]|nr:glycosyltransferase [Bacteroidales bacterium]